MASPTIHLLRTQPGGEREKGKGKGAQSGTGTGTVTGTGRRYS